MQQQKSSEIFFPNREREIERQNLCNNANKD